MAWRGFTLVFLLVSLAAGAGTLVLGRLPAAVRCRPSPVPGSFVAECRGVGDYDHAAFALGLEPAAVAALARADIVVLGNSRAQFAFSTAAMDDFAKQSDAAIYRAGFGYNEGSAFAHRVLAGAGARPRAIIVNADPFFTARQSPPAIRIRDDPWRALVAGLRSKVALDLRSGLCARLALEPLCRGSRDGVYRVAGTGSWIWNPRLPSEAATEIDAGPGAPLPSSAADAPTPDALARDLLAALDLPPRCLFLTAVPNSQDDASAAASALGQNLGAPAILPRLTGLRTRDGSHLDPPSAERWSAAFLAQAEAGLRDCLSAPRGR
ncbi:hypothetical protein [uncultured Methylobacterium sp.]|uniref:hypothetical protein n=1 Tax=uncultured Methylobacterium sp. TaxID=157278 RepID=UPI0035C9B415